MYNIAIDGPAGAGKSTVAGLVAKKLNFTYVDTGAMYRALALACFRAGIDAADEKDVVCYCARAAVTLDYANGVQQIFLDGENVTSLIRDEAIGNMTSAIAVYPRVRERLVSMQRKLAEEKNVVMDGRDIGSTVLPDANLKIFLTASVRTRAQRRCLELAEKGEAVNLEEIEEDIAKRDYRDRHREVSPLIQAQDAVLIDSSDMTIEEVVDRIVGLVR